MYLEILSFLSFWMSAQSLNCSEGCLPAPDNTTETCNSTGQCTFGCQDHYVGSDCSLKCPATCALPSDNSSDICYSPSGNCTSGCQPGYEGSICSKIKCPDNCFFSPNNETPTCNSDTWACLYGCKHGFAGESCNLTCPSNCGDGPGNESEICNDKTTECMFRCKSRFAGPFCDFECPANCSQSPTRDKGTCNITTGNCQFGCYFLYAGPNCTFECSLGCVMSNDILSDTCHLTTGACLFGCKPGYSGTNCSHKCPENCGIASVYGNETCNSTTDECMYGCLQGYSGNNCSYVCPENCSKPPNNNSQTCDATNNTCLYGCLSGYGGDDCSYNCSDNCMAPPTNNSRTCDALNGTCLYGCKVGFAGSDCNFTCSEHCEAPKEKYNTETCNTNTTVCLNGCKLGYAGDSCDVECPTNCLKPTQGDNIEICNFRTNVCVFGCKEGFYGELCNLTCSENIPGCQTCLLQNNTIEPVCTQCQINYRHDGGKCKQCLHWCDQNPNSSLSKCDQFTGECLHGCLPGSYGRFCDKFCGEGCKNRKCDELDGHCNDGCYSSNVCGKNCLTPCSDGCLNLVCEQSCVCKNGCVSERWGSKCNMTCSFTCRNPGNNSNLCDRTDGSCIYGCSDSAWWGKQCKQNCSPFCIDSKCDTFGKCISGCNSKEVYGSHCDRNCSKHCQNNTCLSADGYCDVGCEHGWFGDNCDKQCSVGCFDQGCNRSNACCECKDGWYGQTCRENCGKACLKLICEQDSGNCSFGCLSGYEGPKCTELSMNNDPAAVLENILGSYWLYVITAVPVVLVTVVSVTIVLVNRRMYTKRKQEEGLLSEDEMYEKGRNMEEKRKKSTLKRMSHFLAAKSRRSSNNTKLPVSTVLENVVHMDIDDFSSEFERLPAGLTKPHKVARLLENLVLNFYNGIYPYDENRVELKRAPDIDIRPESTRKKIKRVVRSLHVSSVLGTFGKGKVDGDYMILEEKPTEEPSKLKIKSPSHNTSTYASVLSEEKFVVDSIIIDTNAPDVSCDDENAYADISLNDDKMDFVTKTKKNTESATEKEKTYDYVGTGEMTREPDDAIIQMQETNEAPYDKANLHKQNTEVILERPFELYDHTMDIMQDGTCKDLYDNKQPTSKLTKEYAVIQKIPRSDTDAQVTLNTSGESAAFSKADDKNDYSNTNLIPPKREDEQKKRDYINASYIKIRKDNRKFIAAQAPAKVTVDDFWLMIWEQRVEIIVMLVDIPEHGFSRCEKYWPEKGKSLAFDDLMVTTDSDECFVDHSLRKFTLTLHGVDREVVQLQFKSWPEDGCPISAIEFIQFHQKYRSMVKTIGHSAPVVVHCTAGVGRTGVFIALDTIFEEGRDRGLIDVFSCVERLREQRPDMVHHLEQYAFLFKAIAQTFALECIPYKKDKIADKFTDLKKFDDTGKSRLQRIFERMKLSLQLDDQQIAAMDQVQERNSKDRPTSDIPDVVFRASLPRNQYINAVVIDTLRDKEGIVVTQMPKPDTLTDFCQLLMHYNIGTIAMLNSFDPNDKSMGVYWPREKETNVMMGTFKITTTDTVKQADFVTRKFKLESSLADEGEPPRDITMVQYKGWKTMKTLPTAKNLVKLLIMTRQHVNETKERKLLVHCLNGSEQSGLFCALYNLLETLDLEDEVSITSIVRKILARRPAAFPFQNQLEVCFTTAIEYFTQTS